MSANKSSVLSLGVYTLSAIVFLSASKQIVAKQTHVNLPTVDKVRECVFRYQFSKFGLSDKPHSQLFFIGIGSQSGKNPSPNLISKLKSSAYKVKGISQCMQSTGGVVDAKTKSKGLAFVIGQVKMISNVKAQVWANYFKNGKSGNDALYMVDKVEGNWRVTKCKIIELY